MPGQYTRLSREVQASEVLAALRNALAHGHVFTEGDPVQLIVFGTARHEKRKLVGYRFLRATVHDVRHLLTAWFDFLTRYHVPYREAAEAVAAAA